MDYSEYLRRLPKVELHCHVEGTLRPATVVDLARKHDIALPTDDVDRIYDYETIYEFLEIFRFVNSTVIDRDDFAAWPTNRSRTACGSATSSTARCSSIPTLHTTRGVPMPVIIDGLIDGARAAEADFGVRCFLIADVYRQDPPAMALQMTEEVIAHRRDEVIGLGMDAAEAPDPPEKFAECFALAGAAGLHRTSHASEDAPPVNITTCLDVLGCERIDHGYHILDDEAVVERCRDEGSALHVLSHLDRGGLRLARPHHAPDQRHDRSRAARAPQLRRPHDVPHRHRQGVRRLRRPERLPARGGEGNGLQRGRRDLARRVRPGAPAAGDSTPRSPTSTPALGGRWTRVVTSAMLSNTDPALRRGWHVVARSDEIGSDPVKVRLLGEDWALVRLPSPARAGPSTGARPPSPPSSTGARTASPRSRPDGSTATTLRCGYHGWCFDADGTCTEIPVAGGVRPRARRGRARDHAGAAHRTGGLVFLAPEAPLTELLDLTTRRRSVVHARHARTGAGARSAPD